MTQADLVLDFTFPELLAPLIDSAQGKGPIADAITAGMWAAVDTLAEAIVMETPVNVGHLSTAISQAKSVNFGNSVWTGIVSDGGIAYGLPVEFGRKPGRRPPIEPIEFWIKRKGIQWSRKLKSGKTKPMTTNQMAWALAMHIAAHGTKGAFMFREGLRIATPAIDKIFQDTMDEMAQKWGAGA
jgi:hypothetical protein